MNKLLKFIPPIFALIALASFISAVTYHQLILVIVGGVSAIIAMMTFMMNFARSKKK